MKTQKKYQRNIIPEFERGSSKYPKFLSHQIRERVYKNIDNLKSSGFSLPPTKVRKITKGGGDGKTVRRKPRADIFNYLYS